VYLKIDFLNLLDNIHRLNGSLLVILLTTLLVAQKRIETKSYEIDIIKQNCNKAATVDKHGSTFTRFEFVSNANFSSAFERKIANPTDYFDTTDWIFQL
jgi:hypothetical protein